MGFRVKLRPRNPKAQTLNPETLNPKPLNPRPRKLKDWSFSVYEFRARGVTVSIATGVTVFGGTCKNRGVRGVRGVSK